MDIKIEKMTLTDLEAIQPILVREFDDFWTYSILKEELQSNNSNYLIAKLDKKIVGFAGIKIVLNEADIMNIVTKKSFRNQGIGTLLLQHLLSLCKELKLSSLSLEVNETNLAAIHLYEKFGFKTLGLRKNYYQNKSGLIMTKKLN
ncbi:MAG: ribosomal protein S18-alanine N-acetyltransferase [Clostridia bacterium]|nr:ribosomal protein S18-alanine N-acetyltransferase [Clostridia bacterium]